MRPDHEVAVIGAGPAGIAAGVKLKRAGISDFAILERGNEVGGSWRDNTYPGICVDIPSLAYQYSFARNPDWHRVFARGSEVERYHIDVARRFGLYDHVRFNTGVAREVWDDEQHVWRLHTTDGRQMTARFVISAVGAFINAKDDPGIPGYQDFKGKIQRPGGWDHSYDHTGKRVAVIGTGASSVQITPSIAPDVDLLEVYQRTPVWCLPKPDFDVPRAMRVALRVPGVAAAIHGVVLVGVDAALRLAGSAPMWIVKPTLHGFDAGSKRVYRALLNAVVKDPETRDGLTPDFGPVAKRPTMSSSYLQTFNRPNTRLITTPIDRITETGIRTADGVDHDLDMIVLATGYEVFSDPETYRPGTIVGRQGFDLAHFFAEHGLQAYESVAIPRFPNRWMLVGPYSWTGTGWHAFVEITANHAARAIRAARQNGATLMEVRQDVHDAYHAEVRKRARGIQYYFSVLNRDVRTYYRNSQGDMAYLRPSSYFDARWRSNHFPLDHYIYETLDATTRGATSKASANGKGRAGRKKVSA